MSRTEHESLFIKLRARRLELLCLIQVSWTNGRINWFGYSAVRRHLVLIVHVILHPSHITADRWRVIEQTLTALLINSANIVFIRLQRGVMMYEMMFVVWFFFCVRVGGIRGAMVARWTAGQHVERPILHQRHDSLQIHLISPWGPRPSIAIHVQNRGLKHHSFHLYERVLL